MMKTDTEDLLGLYAQYLAALGRSPVTVNGNLADSTKSLLLKD